MPMTALRLSCCIWIVCAGMSLATKLALPGNDAEVFKLRIEAPVYNTVLGAKVEDSLDVTKWLFAGDSVVAAGPAIEVGGVSMLPVRKRGVFARGWMRRDAVVDPSGSGGAARRNGTISVAGSSTPVENTHYRIRQNAPIYYTSALREVAKTLLGGQVVEASGPPEYFNGHTLVPIKRQVGVVPKGYMKLDALVNLSPPSLLPRDDTVNEESNISSSGNTAGDVMVMSKLLHKAGDVQDEDWEEAVRKLPEPTAAGIIYVELVSWPKWIGFMMASAASNTNVTFYFMGPYLDTEHCANCVWLPMDKDRLRSHIRTNLRYDLELAPLIPAKLSDVKPMLPAIFPGLSRRHTWIGYADLDVVLGDLDSELETVDKDAELLTPSAYYPQPLVNEKLLLVRSTDKMIQAYRRSPGWLTALQTRGHCGFDVWKGSCLSMMEVYYDMLLNQEFVARPTQRMLVQDDNMISASSATIVWSNGSLLAQRNGPCRCPQREQVDDDNKLPLLGFALTGCEDCLRTDPQQVNTTISHSLQVLGFDFGNWKRRFKAIATSSPRVKLFQKRVPHSEEHRPCHANFELSPVGFRCKLH